MKHLLNFSLVFVSIFPLLSEAAFTANRRNLLKTGPASLLLKLIRPALPAANPTHLVIPPEDLFSPQIQDPDGSMVRNRAISFHRLWVDSDNSQDLLRGAAGMQKKTFLTWREIDIFEDWLRNYPNDAFRRELDKYKSNLHIRFLEMVSVEDLILMKARAAAFGLTRDRYNEQSLELTKNLFELSRRFIDKAPWNTLSWTQVFGPRIAKMELELAHKYQVGVSKVHHAVDFGIHVNVKIETQIRKLLVGISRVEDLQLYNTNFIKEYVKGLATIFPEQDRFNRPGSEGENWFRLMHATTRTTALPNDISKIFDVTYVENDAEGFPNHHKGLSASYRSFHFTYVDDYRHSLEETGVPDELVQNYLELIQNLTHLREVMDQLPNSEFQQTVFEQTAALLIEARQELETLPQRLQARRELYKEYSTAHQERRKFQMLKFPPNASSEWRTVGFVDLKEAALQSVQWLTTVRELGIKLGVGVQVLESLAEAIPTSENTTCTPLLIAKPPNTIESIKIEDTLLRDPSILRPSE